ncbi:ATP-grasp domain-containing protein [Streptomyces sp. NPDC004051]
MKHTGPTPLVPSLATAEGPATAPDRPAVLVLGGGTRLPRALRAHGMYVVYGGTRDEFGPGHRDACDEALLLPDDHEDTWVRRAVTLHGELPFRSVVTVRERFLTIAARIRDVLALQGNTLETVLALKDKVRMRERLDGSPDGTAVRARLLHAPGDVDAFIAEAGLPVVVKPRDGSGSESVLVVSGADDMAEAARRVAARPGGLLAEEFLDGPEFSVESFSEKGEHHILAVTEKFTGENAVEIGHVVPARIEADQYAALADATRWFLDAMSLTEGPAHTEIILTRNGPRIVESHNRPGGDGIIDLVREVSGTDVRDLLAAQLAGLPFDSPRPRAPARAAATWFATACPGVVTDVTGWQEAAASPGVVTAAPDVAPGDTVTPLRGSDDRCGAVIAVGATPDEALDRARAALSLVRIVTEPCAGRESPAHD